MLEIYLPVEDIKFGGYSTICAVCYKQPMQCPLQKCSGCKLVQYCSKEHQKDHWPKHKQLCKAVQMMIKTTNNVGLFDDYVDEGCNMWTLYRQTLIYVCEGIIKRQLFPEEKNLFLFPLCCKICHTNNYNRMITCSNCCVTSYCSEDHRDKDKVHHSQVCSHLKFILDFRTNCQNGFLIEGSISDIELLPCDMQSFVNDYSTIKTKPAGKEIYAKTFVNNSLSICLTVIYIIEKSKILESVNKEKLTLHLVGSAQYENSSWWAWEYVFHYFKNLKSINLVFIGPESSNFFLPPVLSCQDCRNSRAINFSADNTLYHEYITKNVVASDVIVAFNCGFHEFEDKPPHDTWKSSMKSFCNFSNSVVAFTSYNKNESERDLKTFMTFCGTDNLEVIDHCKENPFRSLLPIQDWCESGNIFYNNYFINILKNK